MTWTGPDNNNDVITIAEIGSAANKRLDSIFTDRGNPSGLTAPKTPGTYEIRYTTGQGNRILAMITIVVR